MKRTYITILGLSTLSLGGCKTNPAPDSPPPSTTSPSATSPETKDAARRTFNPPRRTLETADPTWDAVAPPTEGAKAELIVTPTGCYKTFVPAGVAPRDRYEQSPELAELGTRITCPDRAKDIPKTEIEIIDTPPEPIRENPPRPQKQTNPPAPSKPN